MPDVADPGGRTVLLRGQVVLGLNGEEGVSPLLGGEVRGYLVDQDVAVVMWSLKETIR